MKAEEPFKKAKAISDKKEKERIDKILNNPEIKKIFLEIDKEASIGNYTLEVKDNKEFGKILETLGYKLEYFNDINKMTINWCCKDNK